MNTDRWHYRVFQSAPDLIRVLLPNRGGSASGLGLNPDEPGDRHYRFEAPELKELNHRLDGVLWPRESTGCAETGSPEFPVVLLDVLNCGDPGRTARRQALYESYGFQPLPSNPTRLFFSLNVIRELLAEL